MKNILAVLLIGFTTSSAAQTAQDFTLTDLDGRDRNLYSTLDNDTVVVLKFFTNWCSVCNNTADEVVGLYNEYMFNGDPVTIWAIDRQDSEGTAGPTSFRDNHSLPFPVFAFGESVANSFGVQYQPEYKIVCKDRSYEEEVSNTQVDQHVQTCLAQIGVGINNQTLDGSFFSYQENGLSHLSWNLSTDAEARLMIYDIAGRSVVDRKVESKGVLSSNEIGSGVYTATLSDGNGSRTLRFAVIR